MLGTMEMATVTTMTMAISIINNFGGSNDDGDAGREGGDTDEAVLGNRVLSGQGQRPSVAGGGSGSVPNGRHRQLCREESLLRVISENQDDDTESFRIWNVEVGSYGGRLCLEGSR